VKLSFSQIEPGKMPRMADLPKIVTEKRGHLLLVAFNRPAKQNAFDADMLRELSDAFGTLEADPDLRCGVVFANGEHFTSGMDLAGLAPVMDGSAPSRRSWRSTVAAGRLASSFAWRKTSAWPHRTPASPRSRSSKGSSLSEAGRFGSFRPQAGEMRCGGFSRAKSLGPPRLLALGWFKRWSNRSKEFLGREGALA
jgi:hypothetical protein